MKALLVALGFLTRIPVPASAFADARARRNALAWYPLVGLLIGALLAGAHALLATQPPLLQAALLLALWVGITGAMHLDGLADSADAWVGGMGDRQKTLAIMKDPRSGPVAVVAVVMVLLVKFAALASLPPMAWPVLLLAPLLARTVVVLAFVTSPYVREAGMGSAMREAPRGAAWGALLFAGLATVVMGTPGGVAAVMAMTVFALWLHAVGKRLGGFTGDLAGALVELVEVSVLVSVVLLLLG